MKVFKKGYIRSKKSIIIFLFLFTGVSCFSLFLQKYIIDGQDFMFHFSRLEGVIDNIKGNNLFNGIYYNQLNGYGYASPLFYPDIFLYFPAFLVVLGIGKYSAYKIFLFLISFLSISFMYLATKSITNDRKTGLLTAILYAASSYRLTDIFERCALGEIITFVFLPLVFWGIYEIIYRDKNKYWLLVVGMSGLILSHLITSVLTCAVLFMILLVNIKKLLKEKDRIIKLIYSVLFTTFLTSYFIFPMLEQMLFQKYAVNYMMNSFSISDYSTRITRLFLAVPGMVYCNLSNSIWLPAGLGISFMIILFLTGRSLFKKEFKNDNNFSKVTFILGIVCLLFSTNLFPWNLSIIKRVFSFMQFPWRILSISTVLILFSFAFCCKKSEYYTHPILTSVIILFSIQVILVFNLYNLSAKYLQDTFGSDFDTISFGEYLPLSEVIMGWGTEQSKYYYDRENKAVSKDNILLATSRKNQYLIVNYDYNETESEVILPLLYYKGYDIKVNDKMVLYDKNQEGLIKVKINNQKGKIVAYYKGTKISYYTKIISLISFIFFVVLVLKKEKIFKIK